jgi:predicted dithiol-disulfide oxidoreductase (DUF899 family)
MPDTLHGNRYPGESNEYRSARNELLRAELELRRRLEEVAALRRGLPLGGKIAEDYVFDEIVGGSAAQNVKQTRLSELFAPGKNSLILYSFMFGPKDERACPMCTSFLDGLDGYARHITQRVNLAIVAKAPMERIRDWAAERGWRHLRLLSSARNTYNADYFAETPDRQQLPACNVFTNAADGIRHFYATELLYVPTDGHPRHVDLLWPIWSFLDLTPEGRGTDWMPQLTYD